MTLRLTIFLATLTTLAIIHSVANEFYLYWKYLWLDIPVHLLGGVTVALGLASLPFFGVRLFERYGSLSAYVLTTFVVGTAWEIFEFTSGIVVLDETFIPDTVLDLSMDVLGGALGYGLVQTLRKI